MSKRHVDALYIQLGASNPSGVLRALADAVAETVTEGVNSAGDPAVRLILHQLVYIMPANELAADWGESIYECCRLAGGQMPEVLRDSWCNYMPEGAL